MTLQEFLYRNPENRTIANFIKELRKEFKMTQDELSDRSGCPRNIISAIENGYCEPSPILLHSILSIFGLSSINSQDMWVLDKDYYTYLKVKEIEKLLINSDIEKIETLVKDLEKQSIFKKGFNLQFILFCKAILMDNKQEKPEKVIKLSYDALDITFKKFEEKLIGSRLLSYTEISLINLIACQNNKLKDYKNAINLLEKLKKSINKYIIDKEEKKKTYPTIFKNLIIFLNKNIEFEKAIETGKEGIIYCISERENNDYPYILAEYAYALEQVGESKASKKYSTQAYNSFILTERFTQAKMVQKLFHT